MVQESPQTTVLTFSLLPTTKLLLASFLSSTFSSNHVVLELSTASEDELRAALKDDGMVVCAGSLAKIAHLLAPAQRAFFDATEDSHLFRTLIQPAFPDFICYKSSTPWSVELDWSGGRRFVVKPNIGYSSVDTFVVGSQAELAALETAVTSSSDVDFIIEEFIAGTFICADLVMEKGAVAVTSVYYRYDYGIKETAQAHTSALYGQHAGQFRELATNVVARFLPLPDTRVMFNVEAKHGVDGVLRIIEINPFRACGVAPLAASRIFGRNVFDLAFAPVLDEAVVVPEGDREVVAVFARERGQKAVELLPPILEAMARKDGKKRRGVELERMLEEEDFDTFAISEAVLFDIVSA